MKSVVKKYREAAQKLFGANVKEAEVYIIDPKDDPGEWAPESLCVIRLERDGQFPEDEFKIADALDSFADDGLDNCVKLAEEAGIGYIEYINAAVAAVYK